MKRIAFSALVAGAALSVGCAQLQDSRLEARNRSLARGAWRNQGGAYQYAEHPVHFREGFIAGYSDVASGGDGCPPALPLRDRRSWKSSTRPRSSTRTTGRLSIGSAIFSCRVVKRPRLTERWFNRPRTAPHCNTQA